MPIAEQIMLTGWPACHEDFPFEAQIDRDCVRVWLMQKPFKRVGDFYHYPVPTEVARTLVADLGMTWPSDPREWELIIQPLHLR